MKALRFHQFGGPEVMQIDGGVAIPEPGPGEVLIKVAGSGVNPVDWKIREGSVQAYFPVELPAIMSREFSGTVDKLGDGVSEFQIGDQVYGHSQHGTAAEYTIAKVGEFALKPVGMDLPDAAAVPLAGTTALQALFGVANLQAGQRVLILAASGGVGTFAVQIAKWRGATVFGTASGRNHHLLRELGADELIDYHDASFETVLPGVDVVLAAVGGDETMLRALQILKPGGILVSITSEAPTEEAERHGKRAEHMFMRPSANDLTLIGALIQDLKIQPVIDAVVPFDEAIEAQKRSQEGHVVGKLVVDVNR